MKDKYERNFYTKLTKQKYDKKSDIKLMKKDYDKILDTKIINLNELTEKGLSNYNLNKKDLYFFDKTDEDEKYNETLFKDNEEKISKSHIINISTERLSDLEIKSSSQKKIYGGAKISTYYEKPSDIEIKKIIDYINIFSNIGIHIPFDFCSKKYYIELTGKKDKKFVISISMDRRHKDELIHISCFPTSFIHITFIYNDTGNRMKKHYKLYQLSNPDYLKGFLCLIEFIISTKKIFDLKPFPDKIFTDNPTNNWKNEIITDKDKIKLFIDNLYILLQGVRFIMYQDIRKYIYR
jgi:hypothetical protein